VRIKIKTGNLWYVKVGTCWLGPFPRLLNAAQLASLPIVWSVYSVGFPFRSSEFQERSVLFNTEEWVVEHGFCQLHRPNSHAHSMITWKNPPSTDHSVVQNPPSTDHSVVRKWPDQNLNWTMMASPLGGNRILHWALQPVSSSLELDLKCERSSIHLKIFHSNGSQAMSFVVNILASWPMYFKSLKKNLK
jgi:hypothetical protein